MLDLTTAVRDDAEAGMGATFGVDPVVLFDLWPLAVGEGRPGRRPVRLALAGQRRLAVPPRQD